MTCLCWQAGHHVVVYERNDRCGGLLRYGIPTMKLSKDVSIVYAVHKLLHDWGMCLHVHDVAADYTC